MTTPVPEAPVPTASRRPPRLRRVLAVAAGVAVVPAAYAVASAATGGGGSSSNVSAGVAAASRPADDPGPEAEVEHGVVMEKPRGGATTPRVPEVTTPTTPEPTVPTTPEQEVEHPVPEPGDDNGVDAPGDDRRTPTAAPAGTQSFSSVGGSIVVSTDGTSLSLVSSTPAAGFGTEVHDNAPGRVEVRFTNGDVEWRIRVELGAGGFTSEVTQHG